MRITARLYPAIFDYTKTPSIYHDRLGTNIGKTQKRGLVFSQEGWGKDQAAAATKALAANVSVQCQSRPTL